MSFSESYFRTLALEAALEWMLWRLVSTSNDPRGVLVDFETHMKEREEATREAGMDQLMKGKTDTWSNCNDNVAALEELREGLVNSVKFTG